MKMIGAEKIRSGIASLKRAKDTDFLYASAYIRSIEEKGLCRETLSRMLEAPTAKDAEAILRDVYSDGDSDAICDEIVNAAYKTIGEVVSDKEMFSFMRYPYDANNIKTAIKCVAKGIPTDGLFFGCATLAADEYVKMAENGEFSALPKKLGDAAKEAFELFKKTGDPQSIDLPIDKACLSLMAEKASETGSRFILDSVMLKIDIANVLSTKRIVRMSGETVKGTLERTLSAGGNIAPEKLVSTAVSENPEESLNTLIEETVPTLSPALSSERLGEIERGLENSYLEFVYSAKKVPFGIEVPFAYLVSSEYNAKNARIILAGKRAGLDADKIRERMRIYYV